MDLILCTAVDLASLRCGAGGSARVAGKASSSNSGRTMLNSGIAAGSMTMAGVGQTASVSAERALDAWERDGGRATRVAHRAINRVCFTDDFTGRYTSPTPTAYSRTQRHEGVWRAIGKKERVPTLRQLSAAHTRRLDCSRPLHRPGGPSR